MIYQNSELDPQWFVSDDNQRIATWCDLKSNRINRDIYFSPTNTPRVNRQDVRQGSCFSDWYVPSPSELFYATQQQIKSRDLIAQNLSLDSYKQKTNRQIEHSLAKAFKQHEVINLNFSGSLDSMILLAFIMRMGLGHRTRLISISDLIITKPDALRYDIERQNHINNFFERKQESLHSTHWMTVTVDDLVCLINQGAGIDQLLPYTLGAVSNQWPAQAWIGGYHGNRTILHQRVFLDQMRIEHPDILDELREQIAGSWTTCYTHSIKKLDLNLDPIHLAYQSNNNKPWHRINGFRDSHVYLPMGTEQMFQDLRRLDPSDLYFDLVAHAKFGRELVENNSPDLLEWITGRQSENDLDNIESTMLPADRINFQQLKLPLDICHDHEGRQWLEYSIDLAQRTKEIEFNTVLSIKNLQKISWHINNFSNAAITATSDQIDA